MKVLVSACIMGVNGKCNGKNNENITAINFLKDKEVISICPEVLAGMKIPRSCAEIVNGRVVDKNGNDVSLEYDKAVSIALSKIQNKNIFPALHRLVPQIVQGQMYQDPGRFLAAYSKRTF